MAAPEFVGVEVSPNVEAKINSDHGVTVDDVLDALEAMIHAIWDVHESRGRRLYVWGYAGPKSRVIFVCLWPVDHTAGEWRLVTAYPDSYP